MDRVKNFDHFYEVHILPLAAQLQQEHAAAGNWKWFSIGTGIASVLFFALSVTGLLAYAHVLAFILLGMCIYGIRQSLKTSETYFLSFKEKIIRRIITYIHPGAVYKPTSYISRKEYKASGLFRRRFSYFEGDDYWECQYRDIFFHSSEIETWYQDAMGKQEIFKGLFFAVRLNFLVTGGTYVWSKNNVQLPKSLADEHYRMYSLPPVHAYSTTDEAFNKSFAVYTTNTAEAAMILAGNMKDHMLFLKQRLKKDIVFSFVNGRCFVAVPFDENLLEPTAQSLPGRAAVKSYFYTVLLVFNIIRKLELHKLT